MNNHGYLFKSVIVGPCNTGKSSICSQISTGVFPVQHLHTIGVDFKTFVTKHDGLTCKYQLWDTAGQERFDSITDNYYRGAAVVIVTGSVDVNLQSFKKKVEKALNTDSLVILVLNKMDLDSKYWLFQAEEYEKLATEHDLQLFKISAKNADDVIEMFNIITKMLVDKMKKGYKVGITKRESLSINTVQVHDTACCWS